MKLIAEDTVRYLQEWVCVCVAERIFAEAEDETENCSSWVQAYAKEVGRIQVALRRGMAVAQIQKTGIEV